MRSFSTRKIIIFCIAVLSLHTSVSAIIPEARNVTITPAGPYVPGALLTGSYTYFDADGNAQNVPATEIGWYRSTSASGTSPSLITSGTAFWLVTSAYRGSYVAFGVRVTDAAGEVGVRTYSNWYLINALPQATDDNYIDMAQEGGTLTIPAPGVLSNDNSGGDAQTIQSSVVTNPAYGALTLNPNGSFSYVHNGSEDHTDQFTYRVFDGLEYSATNATVHLQVTNGNDPPLLSNIELTPLSYTEGESAKAITATLLVNDPENDDIDSAQIRIIDGYVSLEDRFSYTPTSPFTGKFYQTLGIYSITGRASESLYQTALRNVRYYNSNNLNPNAGDREIEFIVFSGGDSSLTVSRIIDLTAVNDAPVAFADNYSGLAEGGTLTIPAPGVLANDTDLDGPPPISAVLVSSVINGSLTLNSNGSFTYTHNGSNNLSDAFTYYAYDSHTPSSIVTVNISLTNVNDPPVLSGMEPLTLSYDEEDGPRRITLTLSVLDEDDNDIESATASITLGFHMHEDSLTWPAVPGLTIAYDTLTGILTATGTATKATYQNNLLRNIRYWNTNKTNPSTALRRVTFVVNDGDNNSNSVYRNIQIVPANDPPVASEAELLGTNFYVDELLTVDYTYTDPDGDPEGNTAFKWFTATNAQGAGRTQISAAVSNTFTTRISEGGKYLSAVVRPYDIIGLDGVNDTTAWYYINAAPDFENFTIANRLHPGAIAVGQVVSADFTYTDQENNPAGNHTFQWYRSNTGSWLNASVLSGQTDTTLLITQALNGRYIAVEGTPYATQGSSPGELHRSTWFFVSEAPSATISGLDSICNNGTNGILTVNLTGENPPWAFRYYIAGEEDTIPVTGITETHYELEVSDPGTYRLADVSDDEFEFGTVSGEGIIAYYPQPSATLPLDQVTICDNDEADYVIPVNLAGKSPWQISYHRSGQPDSTTVAGIVDPTYEIEITVTDLGTYSVLHVWDANCMAPGTGSTQVLEKDSPMATMSGDTLVCPSDDAIINVDLQGNGPWTYYYTIDEGDDIAVNVNVNQSSYSHKLTVDVPGVYRVVRVVDEDDEGCVYGTAEIGHHVIPTATLTGNDSTCAGSPKLFPVLLTGDSPWNITYRENTLPPVSVNNIQSTPYYLPAYNDGNYRVLTVEDEHCTGTGTGIANLKVNPLPLVNILGLDTIYSLQTPEVPVNVEPFGGDFESSSYPYATILKNGQWTFYTAIAYATFGSPFWIRYSYPDPTTGCMGMDEHRVFILSEAAEIQIDNEKDMYCFNDDTLEVFGVNIRDNLGSFSISGNQGLIDLGNNRAHLLPWQIGSGQKTLTYTVDIDGELIQVQKTFNFGKIDGDFTWDNECLVDGEAIVEFSDQTTSNYDLVSYEWKFYLPNDTVEFSGDEVMSPVITFNGYGPYDIEYTLTSEFNQDHCYDTVRKAFTLKPTYDVHAMPYDQSFTAGKAYWNDFAVSADGLNSWKFGTPDEAVWNGVSTSEKAWYTDIDDFVAAENSYVISPCFDFTNAQRPMIKLDLWRKFALAPVDGAVIQYTLDNGNTWKNIGEQGDGINWFNVYGISGNPGSSSLGWSNIQDNGWITARHKLDTLKGKPMVRFRMAYGNPEDFEAFPREGMAFDNFWIGERDKKVLIEHFTNASDAGSVEVNHLFNTQMNSTMNRSDIIDIQYHLGEPSFGPDTFHMLNPVHPDSRALYYSISDIPYGIIDGGRGNQNTYLINYHGGEELDQNTLTLAALEENVFDIIPQTTKGIESVDIDVQVIAKQAFPEKPLTLHVVVIENLIQDIPGNNGETRFESVFRTMLPNAIGSPIERSWEEGDIETFHLCYVFKDIFSENQLRIIAFLQDNENLRIYQAEIRDPNAIDPVESPTLQGNAFSVYPNPAREHTSIQFTEPLQEELRLELVDFRGGIMRNTRIQAGTDIKTLSTAGLDPGLYIIRILSTTEIVGYAKLVILGNNR